VTSAAFLGLILVLAVGLLVALTQAALLLFLVLV
jgi:hypothetical protein